MGYVIQQTGLFPHMTVADNVATVPRLWDWDAARVKARVDELLELVGLPPREYRRRYPHQLSGGQRQRVGFARALGADPPILLMDEPFGAVDRITRERLQHEFISIQRSLGKTVVFVTHDIDEAVMVGDRICLMKMQAEVAQYDTPDAILTRPASAYVSEFLGRDRLVRRMSIERGLVGGECPYWGCVPSKTLLRSGETLAEAGRARNLAASRVEWDLDFPKVSKRVLWMARDLDDTRPAAALEATGAKLIRGEGKPVRLRTVGVGGAQLVARRAVVIANGGTAAIPPIEGLDNADDCTTGH